MSTATAIRHPMTALDPGLTMRQPKFRGGQMQIWQAVSACGAWLYERTEETGTPWRAEHLPTGLEVHFTNLPEARRWTAKDDGRYALGRLRDMATEVAVRRGYTDGVIGTMTGGVFRRTCEVPELAAQRFALATRQLAVLAGDLVAGEPYTRCRCGRFLLQTVVAGRPVWRHADVCESCAHRDVRGRRLCARLVAHQVCEDPEPVLCEHWSCTAPVLLFGDVCRFGKLDCSGCCHG